MTTARDRLQQIKARAGAATEGPWTFYGDDLWFGITAEQLADFDAHNPEADESAIEGAGHIFCGDPERSEDALFIAHARQDLPRLVAFTEALLDLAEVKYLPGWVHTAILALADQHLGGVES